MITFLSHLCFIVYIWCPMQNNYFKIDLSNFWDDSDYALESYVEAPPTDELIHSIEQELGGYKLPASYIELMKMHNGGTPHNTCFPTKERTSWAEDHIAITGIMGIGREKTYSLCGDLGSNFMLEDWGYPEIGICICDCPSAGHDMIMLDYSKCGKNGEPEVVHVDQENDYKITFLAPDFASFINGLVSEGEYDNSAEELKEELEMIATGSFSEILQEFIQKEEKNFDTILRKLLTTVATTKGYFALHADELSYLAYDIQFYLYSRHRGAASAVDYLEQYGQMIALAENGISTNGYAEDFVEDWLNTRVAQKQIVTDAKGQLVFTGDYQQQLLAAIGQYQ